MVLHSKENLKHSFGNLSAIRELGWMSNDYQLVGRRNFMTSNQIAYSKAREEARHNRVSERHEHYDTRSRRMQAEAAATQAETGRQQTAINWWSAQEAKRANQAKEAENYRHNFQSEQLDMYKHMTAAAAAQDQARAALRQADTATRVADIRNNELAETMRRNLVLEGMSQKEISEAIRHAKAQESISRSQVAETTRTNKAREALESQSLTEQARHNMEGEAVAKSQANSAFRQASAAERRAYSDASRAASVAKEAETHARDADTRRYQFYVDTADTAVGIARDIAATVGRFAK